MTGLRAERIRKAFGGVLAVDQVSIAVSPGEIVGLIGPNGSGKTTLLNVIAGVYPPDRGRVSVDNRDVTGRPSHRIAREGIARTFQNIRLFGELSVLENAQVGAQAPAGNRRERPRLIAWKTLERLDLASHVTERATTLPYGAQRRVEIARALAANPRYLLLDEPAAGMNEAESDELLKAIRRFQADLRIGLLVIDHDLRLIMRLCDRVVVLNEGRVIAEGGPSEIQQNPDVVSVYVGTRAAEGRTSRHATP
jgi:branched-chain amino acid transport system permease protein